MDFSREALEVPFYNAKALCTSYLISFFGISVQLPKKKKRKKERAPRAFWLSASSNAKEIRNTRCEAGYCVWNTRVEMKKRDTEA